MSAPVLAIPFLVGVLLLAIGMSGLHSRPMPAVTFLFAVLLLAVGLGGFVASQSHALHALIPAALGALLLVCAAVGRNAKARMHAMHAAVLLALLGFLGGLPGVFRVPALLTGTSTVPPVAVVSRSATAVLCLAYVVVAVRSFIQARRNRLAAQGAETPTG
jgi:hypothetical protein